MTAHWKMHSLAAGVLKFSTLMNRFSDEAGGGIRKSFVGVIVGERGNVNVASLLP